LDDRGRYASASRTGQRAGVVPIGGDEDDVAGTLVAERFEAIEQRLEVRPAT
jgi:hypothetical protein